MAEKYQPLMASAEERRVRLHKKTVEGLEGLFPIVGKRYVLEAENISVAPKDFTTSQQKNALLRGLTLHEPITASLKLRDTVTGKVVDTEKKFPLLRLPFFTNRHTFVLDGNEYDVPHQLRLKSGVYTRERANGEMEAQFNLSKGSNFRLSMEPKSGRLNMELGSSKIPLYSVLKALDVPDVDIRKHWGADLRDVNASKYRGDDSINLNKLISKVRRSGEAEPTSIEGKKRLISEYFQNTAMDPKVTESTLGIAAHNASPMALLAASKKLIQVQKGEAEEDDRDSLEYKTIHSVDDFFKERLALDAKRTIVNKLKQRMSVPVDKKIRNVMPSAAFTKSINSFITSSNLSSTPTQINPVEILDHASRITSLGEGGIGSVRGIPISSRKVHNTHLGIIDPVRTSEADKIGVDVRASIAAHRDDTGTLYTAMTNTRTNRVDMVPVHVLARSVIGFSGQDHRKGKVDAIKGANNVSVNRADVDYFLPAPEHMFGPAASLVPLIDGIQGNRALMGSKFQTQALPLVEREAPLVQASSTVKGLSTEQAIARMVSPTSTVNGTVTKVDADYIYIRPDGPKTAAASSIKIPYNTYFPLSSKTYLHDDVKVKKGDSVKQHQVMANSNFTKDDTLALGKNMSVGYMAYYGKNSNDAVVISESAANKLTSEHMYKEVLAKDSNVVTGKNKFIAYYPNRFTQEQLGKLDERGMAKEGVTLNKGDPLILGLRKSAPTPEAAMMGNFHKSLVRPYKDIAITWEKIDAATVQDTVDAAKQLMVTVRTRESMKIGDKLSNRFGGKGVVSEIIPHDQMVKDEAGDAIDVLFTSAGVVSRINPAQIVESALGKVAAKTGKPIIMPSFNNEDNVQFAKKLLAKHGVKDKETVYDPVSGKHIDNIFVGKSYIHKLFKSTDTNYSARGVSNYDINLQPTKGGDEGAKGLGRMELNALLSHNARNVLKEALTIKSEKSDDFWRAYEFGLPTPPPKTPFASEKFIAMLQGAGINVNKSGTQVMLGVQTDKDVEALSTGALSAPSVDKSKSFMITAKTLAPEKGGLFDPVLTGGVGGTKWSHMELSEPIVNPSFSEPVRRLLGLTKNELRAAIGAEGGSGLKTRLNALDLAKLEKTFIDETKTKRGVARDSSVKKLKYLRALKAQGYNKAGDAYIISKIPVIPPVVRPILPSVSGNDIQVSHANYLYRDVGLASSVLGDAKESELSDATNKARQHLYDSTSALFGWTPPTSPQLRGRDAKGLIEQIAGSNSPKSGYLHSRILSKRQDLSGRATATPDNTLNMDQIGVPEDMLWTTYSKFIMKGLIQQGVPALTARSMIETRHSSAQAILDREIAQRPMFVNRNPSLHKHNMIAAYPVAVPGKSLRVNPFMEQGQNLDYDGDAMQLHVPIGDAAVEEAQNLTLSKLLFGDKSRDDLMVFPQHEAILGAYMSTASPDKGPVQRFKNKSDAMRAYKAGEIKMNTRVKLG